MAIILYPSGITESFTANEQVFTDEEILNIFNEFNLIRTVRLYEVLNTWCVWGESEEFDESNFNKLASDIMEEDVFSHVVFIHDTEINPAWMLTDQIIYKGYEQFKIDLLMYFDRMAENAIRESEEQRSGENHLLFLNTIGPTEDKRVLFELDPSKQNQEFYEDKNFVHFANKVREYLNQYKQTKRGFYIFHDKKSLIFVKEDGIEFLLNKIIDFFKRNEKYEYCKELTEILDAWKNIRKPKQKLVKKKKEQDKPKDDKE